MEANEAPKKIYVNFPFGERHPEKGPMVTKQGLNAEDIEYIRKDAFIEKACDAYCRLCDTKECGDTGECVWVEKFRKHLMR